MTATNKHYMKIALEEAKKALKKNEVPVGAVIVYQGKVIAKAHNTRQKKQQFYAHAEFIALKKACKKLKTWRLEECELYVTLEPCIMCAGALIQSRIKKVYYATQEVRYGAVESMAKILDYPTNHMVNYEGGILKEESSKLLKEFFKNIREER